MPLSREESIEKLADSGAADDVADGRRVICENGVCRFVDEPEAESTTAPASGESIVVAVVERLKMLGATQVRLESGIEGDDSRVACFLPVIVGSKVLRRFEAAGTTDSEALARIAEQIEAWLQDRR
jgi:hypothetical protein